MSDLKDERDSTYRIAALQAAVARAGQDGGLEGHIDVLALGNTYYQWLTGKVDLKDPLYEQAHKDDKN